MNTHRTLTDVVVESRSGHNVTQHLVPRGTLGVVEYAGRIGGHHAVTFRSATMECNLMARFALPVARIDWPAEREEEALRSDLHLRAAA